MARPHPRLRPWVTRYVGYAHAVAAGGVHRGLPSGHLTLNISLGAPVHIVGMPRADQSPGRFQALLGGLHTAPALIARDDAEYGVELALEPLGVAALTGLPSAELAGHVVDLADLPRPAWAGLADRLAALPDWPSRFALLDRLLGGLLGAAVRESAPPPDVEWAWRRIRRSGGTVRVETLAAELGWSRRHFGERFRRGVGLTPKQAARVVRFERAGALLRRGERLADIAAVCGFADQAHLTGEWRALAGCPPTTWLAEEQPPDERPHGAR